mmetsp:Transcript_3385/g.6702  ORF Transcript_3385/g.6702 Transcript_3385/m.6702 type:complete len:1454 (-) Transcript_3385:94-4455(-)
MVMMTSSSATTSNHHAPMGGMSSPPPTTATNEPTWTPFVSPTPSHLQQQQQQHMNHATMTNSDHHKRYRGGEGKDQHTAQSRPFTSSPWALPPPQYPLQHHHPTAPPAMCIPNHSHHDDQFQQQQQQQHQQQDDESILRGHKSPPTSPRASFSAAGAAAIEPMTALEIPSREHPVAAAAAAKATNFRRQASLGETSTHSATSTSPNRKDRRKSKVSWKKQPSPANNKTSNRRFGNRKKDDSTAVAEAAANVDHEDDRKPRSRPSSWNDPNTYSTSSEAFSSASGLSEPFSSSIPPTAAAAASTTPLMPAMAPIHEALDSGREQSVTASLIGTADEPSVLEAGIVLPAAEAYIEGYYDREFEEKLKGEDAIPASLVPTDTDYKVDKEHAPDVEAMLRRAEQEAISDLDTTDPLSTHGSRHGRGKTAGVSVPLSQACPSDELVHNDNLKVVLVGSAGVDKSSLARAIRQSAKKPRKRTTLGVEVHTWTASDIRFHLWDVQGATQPNNSCGGFGSPGFAERGQGNSQSASAPNFGAHPGTQSLFFSSQSLYLLVWDLACNNPHTHPVLEDDSDDEDDGNEWSREEANKQADRALQEDIENRVLSWVDRIARRGPRSAILPVALIPDEMKSAEAQRRCDRLYELLEARMAWYEDNERAPNVVLDDSKNILCVNYSQNYGIEQLQETMVAIATDTSSSVFTHVGTPVPNGVVDVLDLVKRVKDDHKLIWLDHIIGELGSSVPVDDVINALHFLSSIGEILYFGTEEDDVLSQFVVLSRKWLVSAISCILRNDLKRELTETRRFMNMQCIYSEQQFVENDATRTLGGGTASSCPLLSGEDAKMLWQSMSFMREAADRYWQLNESSASAPTMFYFLERLLVNCGILLPLGMSNYGAGAGVERDEVFFVPSLLTQNDPGDVRDIWTYRSSESWTTTLCHSWLFRDGAPSDLFEHLTVTLLKDAYDFTKSADKGLNPREPPQRSQTVPLGHASMQNFIEEHDQQAIGSVRIQQVVCWHSSLLLKIATVFPSSENQELRESSVEIFVTIVDQNSRYCVASDAMRANMQRVIVSGRGPIGHNGRKLFKGGYRAVIDSVQKTVDMFNNVNMQVICPNCLANQDPRKASTWSYEEVLASSQERNDSTIVCRRGHRIKSNLLTGRDIEGHLPDLLPGPPAPKSVSEILPSVVLVGLWDGDKKRIRNVGSGFIADKKHGLIVTAGHVLFDLAEGKNYGAPYFGMENAKVVIGIIPKDGKDKAVFRYFAEIVADDVRSNVDACVLRITTKMENDVDDEGSGCASQAEVALDQSKLKEENLVRLKMETDFQLEESIRIIGFNQGGEGVFEPGSHILRSPDFSKGYICRMFTAALSDDSDSDSDSESNTFSPREEIVAMCPTISGHSGGPCVNGDGMVIGILSRADPVDRNRCYLVPSTQLKALIKRARNVCSRPFYPAQRPTKLGRISSL